MPVFHGSFCIYCMSLSACVCVFVCMCTCVCVNMPPCFYRLAINLQGCSMGPPILFFEAVSLTGILACWLEGCLASESQYWPSYTSAGIIVMRILLCLFFCGCWGSEPMSSCLHIKISPAETSFNPVIMISNIFSYRI